MGVAAQVWSSRLLINQSVCNSDAFMLSLVMLNATSSIFQIVLGVFHVCVKRLD